MSMNDPIGDMLTRIRNAQMRGKSTVATPASKLRAWVLDVLVGEGYIRGYEKSDTANGQGELVISLKYYEGTPVIRELKRVSKPGRRVYMGVKDIPSVRNGLGVSIVSTPKGVMSDAAARVRQCRRRSALHGLLRRLGCLVLARNRSSCPKGVTASLSGQTVEVKGPKGTRSFTATDDVTHHDRRRRGDASRRAARSKRARAAVGHEPHDGGEPGAGRDRRLQERA